MVPGRQEGVLLFDFSLVSCYASWSHLFEQERSCFARSLRTFSTRFLVCFSPLHHTLVQTNSPSPIFAILPTCPSPPPPSPAQLSPPPFPPPLLLEHRGHLRMGPRHRRSRKIRRFVFLSPRSRELSLTNFLFTAAIHAYTEG